MKTSHNGRAQAPSFPSVKKKFRAAGWRMTPAQIAVHWRMFAQICDALNWSQDEEHRRLWYQQSGIGRVSIKTIGDPEFDKIKAFWLATMKPASVDAQLAQLNMPKMRLITACQALAPDPVIISIAQDKFGRAALPRGLGDLKTLDETQLTDLRNTLQRWSSRKKSGSFDSISSAPEPQTTEIPF